jgi:membrane protease subunit HflK
VLASTSKVMMDYRGSGNLLYLPLDKLMQGAGGPGEGAAAPRPATPEPAPEAATRQRETLRSRERGER